MVRRPLIHIGLPKTGTTTIQDLFMRSANVMSVGKPLSVSQKSARVLHRDDVERLIWGLDAVAQAPISKLRHLRSQADKHKETLVLSDESFSQVNVPISLHRQLAARLHQALPDAHVLIGVREQRALVRSIYEQSDRMMYAALGWPRDVPKSFVFRKLSFNKWINALFENRLRTIVSVLHYPVLISEYQAIFGPENVHVLSLESLEASISTVLDACCPQLSFPPKLRHLNQSSTKMNPYRGGWFPQKLLKPEGFFRTRFSEQTWRSYAKAGNRVVRVLGKPKLLVPGSRAWHLFDEFVPSNRELEELFGISFASLTS